EAGDPSKRKSYLPANKQFLVTRNVPCLRRAISVEEEYDAAGAEVVLDEDGEGWLATHGVQGQYPYKCCLVFHSEFYDLNSSKPEEEEDIPSMDTLDIGRSDGIKSIPSYFSGGKDEEEEDIPDMDTYEDTGDICYLISSTPCTSEFCHSRSATIPAGEKPTNTRRIWISLMSGDHAKKEMETGEKPTTSHGSTSSEEPTLHQHPPPAPMRHPSLLSAKSARSIVRFPYATLTFLNIHHYFP
ncbi:hypothetical protein ACJX0J_035581, partial [Zea mays]